MPQESVLGKLGKKFAQQREHKVVETQLIETKADAICRILESIKDGKAGIDYLASRTSLDPGEVERIGKYLQEQEVTEVAYPVNVLTLPQIKLLKRLQTHATTEIVGDVIESYETETKGVPLKVKMWKMAGEPRPVYEIRVPTIGPYTLAYLDQIRDELARKFPVKLDEITDADKLNLITDNFYEVSLQRIRKDFAEISSDYQEILATTLLHKMYGLGSIELLMADENLEEVAINSSNYPISVYHKKYGWMKTNLWLESEEEIYNYAAQIGRKSGRDITLLHPIMDATLGTGDRVAATLSPISAAGNTITIRRFARNPWTLIHFVDPKNGTMSAEMGAFLWMAIQYEMSMLVAGGTATGKTSVLNSLAHFLPPNQRIITIEDTRELSLPEYLRWNWVPLLTRTKNPEGKGQVSMLDLMVSSLRMRPDRMIVGEVRRKREAEVLFEAMHTGHAVYSTIHADTSDQVVKRLTEPPIEIPPVELEALQLILVQYRDRRRGIRRTYELSEIEGASEEGVDLNVLYRWHSRDDNFEKRKESTRIFSELNLHAGFTIDEIRKELEMKEQILKWMVKQKINTVDNLGRILALYYDKAETIEDAASTDKTFDEVVS